MVEDANQNVLGSITQDWSIFVPKYSVRDKFGNKVLSIEGPFCQCSICGDVDFDVFTKDKSQKVGKITKQWSGLAREMFTDADYFGVTFPLDLDVNIKATLLAATFLIVNYFFLINPQKNLIKLSFRILCFLKIIKTIKTIDKIEINVKTLNSGNYFKLN